MLSFLLNCKRIYNDFIKDEVTVYAAQASFFIVLVLTSAAALLLLSRHSVFGARMLSTCCLLPVTMKILGFEPLFSDFFTCLTSIGFCMLQSYLVGPVLLELIFATYLYQK